MENKQRKFASKFNVKVIDANDQPLWVTSHEGSVVRLSYKTGTPHPVHGTPTYLNAIRVVEVAEGQQWDRCRPISIKRMIPL